mgnify:CR=1 FL=1
MQFLIIKLDDLVGKGLDTWVIIQLILLNVPWMLVLAVPMGILFGSLMSFGNMSAAHEITVIKASGGSLTRMMFPIVVLGLILSAFMFWFNNDVLPESNHQSKTLLNDIKKKKPTFALESGRFTTELDGYTILTRRVDSLSGKMEGITIYDGSNPKFRNIISADSGYINFNSDYSKLVLALYSGEIHQSKSSSQKNYKIIDFKDYKTFIEAKGFAFERTEADVLSRGQRELNIRAMSHIKDESLARRDASIEEIKKHINEHLDYLFAANNETDINAGMVEVENQKITRKEALKTAEKKLNFLANNIRSESYKVNSFSNKANQFEVEIQKKYSIPFACFLFVFVGCPLGILTKGGNFGVSAAISLGFYIIYWIFLIAGEKLADRGFFSPLLSMWIGNFVLMIIGVLLTLRVSNESLRLFSIRKK